MTEAIAVVERLFAAWEVLDVQGVAASFTPDGTWHNMPYAPLDGREKIEAAVGKFLSDTIECRFEILNLAEIAPGVVVAERVDVFRSKDGPELRLPVVGVFETKGDLIKVWRDYFDSAPFAAT